MRSDPGVLNFLCGVVLLVILVAALAPAANRVVPRDWGLWNQEGKDE
jgi:hypothetical protein